MSRGIYVDMTNRAPGPQPGDYCQFVGKRGPGACYLVLESRMVKRRDPKAYPRYTLRVDVVDPADVPSVAKVFEFRWYKRRKKKQVTFEEHMKRPLNQQLTESQIQFYKQVMT